MPLLPQASYWFLASPTSRPQRRLGDSGGPGPRLQNLLCTQGSSETTALLGTFQPPDFLMKSKNLKLAEKACQS